MMTYPETLDFLFAQLPMFKRQGKKAFKKDLTNIKSLCAILDHPQKKFKSIHIGGTNGKGTTSHFVSALCQSHGLKTGLYTSPHYSDFRERIKINGDYIEKKKVVHFVDLIKPHLKKIQPSFFELSVAMAFWHFANEQVDVAIVEVGLGGIFDSTNIIHPKVCAITNISFDHQNILGDSLKLIAKSKAGIIKKGVPAIIGEKQESVWPIFERKAKSVKTTLQESSTLYKVKTLKSKFVVYRKGRKCTETKSDIQGPFAARNMQTALAVFEKYCAVSSLKLDQVKLEKALKSAAKISAYKGRWTILSIRPKILIDSGHNEAAWKEIIQVIQQTKKDKHLVLGFVKDKSLDKLFIQLPKNARYYFVAPKIPRALPTEALSDLAEEHRLNFKCYSSVRRGLAAAKARALKNDFIFVGGSSYVVAEIV